jgi:hypothetical protein
VVQSTALSRAIYCSQLANQTGVERVCRDRTVCFSERVLCEEDEEARDQAKKKNSHH